eukprot:366453-Chlamydomonas_euryale.AAC.20
MQSEEQTAKVPRLCSAELLRSVEGVENVQRLLLGRAWVWGAGGVGERCGRGEGEAPSNRLGKLRGR